MASNDEKVIRGQAWIFDNKQLVQDCIKMDTLTGETYNYTDILVKDIWENLFASGCTSSATSNNYQYKYKESKDKEGNVRPVFFYWEYEMSDSESDAETNATVMIECPRPCSKYTNDAPDFKELEKHAETSQYAKFWLDKLKAFSDNYEKSAAIQKKEIVFSKTQYRDFSTGEITEVNEVRKDNSDLGDITNLLSYF